MAEKQYFVTEEGLASLEQELEYLKTVRRKELAEDQGGPVLWRPFREQRI